MEKCIKLENTVSIESSVDALQHYVRRNNIFSGIPGHVSERDLEEAVISVLSDIKVIVFANDVEDVTEQGNQIGANKKKTVPFVNRKCKKALLNRKKMQNQYKGKNGLS